jgi:hypothetical protein
VQAAAPGMRRGDHGDGVAGASSQSSVFSCQFRPLVVFLG